MNLEALQALQTTLKKRTELPYSWGRKQTKDWDNETAFIYDIKTFERLITVCEGMEEGMRNYALNRWYNFHSAMGIESMFAGHSSVTPNLDKYDKLVDFKINGIEFDHKTSVFPRGFLHDLDYCKQYKKRLIAWLYDNQSISGRTHNQGRLFVMLYDKDNEHWKLKSDLDLIKTKVDEYMSNFDEANLVKMKFPKGTVYSDIIWVEN